MLRFCREVQVSRWEHVKAGIERLFCLVPYELISLEMWMQVMPVWMEVIVNDVPESELQDLKGILRYEFILQDSCHLLCFSVWKFSFLMFLRLEI